MAASDAVIRWLEPESPEIETIAQWRYDAFLKSYGLTLEVSRGHLARLAQRPPGEAALVAWIRGEPVGCSLLVREELGAPHNLSPWLASLFVLEDHRRKGIGRMLIQATEHVARDHGVEKLHLYTDSAEAIYTACGWRVDERFDWDGSSVTLMSRVL